MNLLKRFRTTAVLSIVSSILLAQAASAQQQTGRTQGPGQQQTGQNQRTFSGVLQQKGDEYIQVGQRDFRVNANTDFTRGDQDIRFRQLNRGEEVTVTAARRDNEWVATEVNVSSGWGASMGGQSGRDLQQRNQGQQRQLSSEQRSRDRHIETAIRNEFSEGVLTSGDNVSVSVRGGVATLTGTVDEWEDVGRAVQNAYEGGANRVQSTLYVREAQNRLPNWDQLKSDYEIRRSIERELTFSPNVSARNLNVSVNNGTAVVSGTVNEWSDIGHVVENAYEGGARQVVSRLRAEPDRGFWAAGRAYTGDNLRTAIERELSWSPFVDSDSINVSVNNGVATLSGTVSSAEEMSDAIENAYEGGAQRVINRLRVSQGQENQNRGQGQSRNSDDRLRRAVERELSMSPFVDSDRINVSVQNGTVTLRGVVDEWEDVEDVIENAYEGGARNVRNQLQVTERD